MEKMESTNGSIYISKVNWPEKFISKLNFSPESISKSLRDKNQRKEEKKIGSGSLILPQKVQENVPAHFLQYRQRVIENLMIIWSKILKRNMTDLWN